MDVVQIVPTLPPALSGIGDYATLLADELRLAHGWKTKFVVGDPGWSGAPGLIGTAVEKRSANALLAALEEIESNAPIILHYVGYGYATRGCPFWLVDGIERWKKSARRRLVTIFHELYADGEPIWTSAFWTSPLQRWLASRLARVSDVRRMTTTPAALQIGAMLGGSAAVEVVPVFSTLGEPTTPVPFAERQREMVVFGGTSWRTQAYTTHAGALVAACHRLEIERVLDIGAPVDIPRDFSVNVTPMGPLPAAEARELCSGALAGFFTYPAPYLAKSTIFAAYCASGLTPITQASNHVANTDGLRAGEHFLFASGDDAHWRDPAAVTEAARAWYHQHRLSVHAQGIAARLR